MTRVAEPPPVEGDGVHGSEFPEHAGHFLVRHSLAESRLATLAAADRDALGLELDTAAPPQRIRRRQSRDDGA